MNLSKQMRQSQKLNRKLHQEIKVQSVFDVTIHTIRSRVYSGTNKFFFCKSNGRTSKVCRKKAKSSLSINHSSNVVSETTLVESSKDDLFSIYRFLASNITPPITVFITIAGQNLPIEIDTEASISLLNWETFQKINCESNISLLSTKSKFKTYSAEIVSPKGKPDIEFTCEGNKIKTFLITDAASEVVSTSDNVTLNKIIPDYKVFLLTNWGH